MDKFDIIEANLDCLARGFGSMKEHIKYLKALSFNNDNKEETMAKLESPTIEHKNSIMSKTED